MKNPFIGILFSVILELFVGPSTRGVLITWNTDEDTNTLVEYGTTDKYGKVTSNNLLGIGHSVSIDELVSGTNYHLRIKSKNAAGVETIGPDVTFTTNKDIVQPEKLEVR